jgi:serine/threonine protein kinase
VPGVVLGTVGYMSPEQVRALTADHRSDIFAFGAILYEMLSGGRAFRGDTSIDTMTAILKEDPPDLPVADRQIPPALARIVDRCLAKTPSARGFNRQPTWHLRSTRCDRLGRKRSDRNGRATWKAKPRRVDGRGGLRRRGRCAGRGADVWTARSGRRAHLPHVDQPAGRGHADG